MAEEVVESFLDLGDLGDVPDEHTVEDGEHELRLVTFEKRPGKEKGPFLYTQFEIPDDPLAKVIQHVMMLPSPKDDERQMMKRRRAIKAFYTAFKIPTSGEVKFQDYIGNTGWALLAEQEDKEYGLQNRIRRFVS
jgi:hypothetical protein